MLKRVTWLCVFILVLIPLVYIGAILLLKAFPPPPPVDKYIPLIASCFAFVATLTSVIFSEWFKRLDQEEKPQQTGMPNAPDPTKVEPPRTQAYVQSAERLKQAALEMWNRKEQYKGAAQTERRQGIRYRTALYVWRCALAFSAFHFIAGLAASAVVAMKYPAGTAGASVPWLIDNLHFVLLCIGAVIVPALVYRSYIKGLRCSAKLGVALNICSGGVLVSAILFFLTITPEGLSFLNASGPAQMSPLPTGWRPTGIKVPFIVYVFIQKVLLLPLISAVGIAVYRGVASSVLRLEPLSQSATPTQRRGLHPAPPLR